MGHPLPHAPPDRTRPARRLRARDGVSRQRAFQGRCRRRARLGVSDDRAAANANSGGTSPAWVLVAIGGLVGFVLLTVAVWARVVFRFDQPLLSLTHTWDGNPDIWKV